MHGVIPGMGGIEHFVRLLGKEKALQLCLSGEIMTAQTALEKGLVTKITEQKNALVETRCSLNEKRLLYSGQRVRTRFVRSCEQRRLPAIRRDRKMGFFYNSGLWSEPKKMNYFPVILENHVRYLHALHLLDKVCIDTNWKCSMGLVEFTHVFRNDATGQKVCKVTGKLALIDKNEVICSIPENMRKYMENNEP